MGNEILKQLKIFVQSIMDMLQDGKKSKGVDSIWDVMVSFYQEGSYELVLGIYTFNVSCWIILPYT